LLLLLLPLPLLLSWLSPLLLLRCGGPQQLEPFLGVAPAHARSTRSRSCERAALSE
jgi:hypothetical protein